MELSEKTSVSQENSIILFVFVRLVRTEWLDISLVLFPFLRVYPQTYKKRTLGQITQMFFPVNERLLMEGKRAERHSRQKKKNNKQTNKQIICP